MATPTLSAITNYKKLLAQFSGDTKVLKSIAQDFLNVLDPYFKEIEVAIKSKSPEALRFAAHKMEGAARSFFASKVSNTAHQLELLGHSPTFTNADILLKQLNQQVDELKKELLEIINSTAA